MEETKHWEQLKSGRTEALEALYNLHVDALFAYGMVLCHDDERVKDCIQDMFLAFWNNRAKLTVPTSGKAYLMVSLRRRIFDKGPKSNLETTPIEDHHTIGGMEDNAETVWLAKEDQAIQEQKLQSALNKISDRQREIIHMKFFQEMDYEQIAAIMDLNYQSARNLVARALTAMRKAMIWLLLFAVI